MTAPATGILDQLPYPWHRPAAHQLHEVLMTLYPTPPAAVLEAQRAGVNITWIDTQQAIAPLWKALLEAAAIAHALRPMVAGVRDRLPAGHPYRPFLDDLLAGRTAATDAASDTGFLVAGDPAGELESLLFADDLTMEIGRLPALIGTLQLIHGLAAAVCKLTVSVGGDPKYGTGFRIGPDLLLTNWHVLHRESDGLAASAVTAEFGFDDDGQGGLTDPTRIRCSPELAAVRRDDDWAVVRTLDELPAQWPVIPVASEAAPVVGDLAYIVQHPLGQSKRIGFVRNKISFVTDRVVHYLTDTQKGSSGSPVFDARGRLIALHHRAGNPQEILGQAPTRMNEGVRADRVAAELRHAGIAV